MNAQDDADVAVSGIAAAIGEPARSRMLYCLSDGRARTATELATVAEVAPSTASAHLERLRKQKLVKVSAQGKHRYYSLDGEDVAAALEALSVLAGSPRKRFVPSTPPRLRGARSCYDHLAGWLGVALNDRFRALGWLTGPTTGDTAYEITRAGAKGFADLGIDLDAARNRRRRFAFACVDWSERRPHLGGALGAAVLDLALAKRWLDRDLDSRALTLTRTGRRELQSRLGLRDEVPPS
jgi:DNA-binding transcriptional ArsR family regulator